MAIVSTPDRAQPRAQVAVPLASRPGVAAPPGGGGMTFGEITKILRKRLWVIVLSFLIAMAIVSVGTLVWRMFWPLYSAYALLGVDVAKTAPLNSIQPMIPKDVMDREKMYHARLILINPVLQAAVKKDAVKRTSWFAHRDDPVAALAEDLVVSPVPEANIIKLSLSGLRKEDLPEIVNAVADSYVEYSRDITVTGHTTAAQELQDEKDRIDMELTDTRDQAVRARRDFPNLRSSVSVHEIKLQDLARRLNELDDKLSEARAQLADVEKQQQEGTLAGHPMVQRALEMDSRVKALEYRQTELITQANRLKDKLGPDHRQVQDINMNLKATQAELETRRSETIGMAVRGVISQAQSEVETLAKRYEEQTEKYDEALNTMKDLQANLGIIEGLSVKEKALEENARRIDARLLELTLLSKGGEQTVWIAARANIPKDIAFPMWRVMVPLGIVLGLGIGLGLAFLLELTDTSIKSPSDVSRRVDLPLLGMVPHTSDVDDEIPDLRLAFQSHPGSLFCEAFRQIHTCLLFSGPASQRRTILVASASPLDGRTTVATNLAAATARAGRRVLLIDTNFRQPTIRQMFPQCSSEGLSSALVGRVAWRDLLAEVEPNFHVLPAGTLPPNPAELLASEQMRAILAQMSEEYDQVLLDSAPAMVVTDAVGLSSMVDGVVLVVRAGENTHGIVQRTRDMLNRVGAHIVGVVLNGVLATPGGYLRKNYEAFYDYHQAELPTPPQPAATT